MSSSTGAPADTRRPASRRSLVVAALFSSGICISELCLDTPARLLAIIAAALAVAGVLLRGPTRRIGLTLAVVALGMAWHTWRIESRAPERLRAYLGDEPRLLCIRGTVVNTPRVEPLKRGRFSAFAWTDDVTRFELRVRAIIDTKGAIIPIQGGLWVRLDGDQPEFAAGDVVEITGFARTLDPPRNPGARDVRRFGAQVGIDGRIGGASVSAVRIIEPAEPYSFAQLKRSTRQRAAAWLAHTDADPEARAVLNALLFGERDADATEVNNSMIRLGLAHVLAISGLHLGILAGFIVISVRLTGERPRLEALLLTIVMVGYVLLLPARAPVIRATAMILGLLLAESSGRRYDRITVLGWIMVGVLVWRPLELWSMGFQLSFGVVAALILLSDRFHVHAFGPRPRRDEIGAWRAVWEWMRSACSASLCAWLIATPVIAFHIGIVSPWAAIGTLFIMPPVVVTLGLGYITTLFSLVSPELAGIAAPLCFSVTEWLLLLLGALENTRGGTLYVPRLSLPFTLAWLMMTVWWMTRGHWLDPRTLIATLVLLAWALLAIRTPSLPEDEVLRLDTIAVGDGSCHLIRSGREALLYDCGGSYFALGERELPDALRALGVRRIPTVVISHANLDHYLALPDIVERFGVERVLTGETVIAVGRDPESPVHQLMHELKLRGIAVEALVAGDTFQIGNAAATVLSPPEGRTWRRDNDSSVVLDIAATTDAGLRHLLMCGDIETEAMLELEASHPDLQAAVLEVPHHGSARPAAFDFVLWINPEVAIQSTGPRRLHDERWDHVKRGRRWHTTASEGAIRVSIRRDGSVTSRGWQEVVE